MNVLRPFDRWQRPPGSPVRLSMLEAAMAEGRRRRHRTQSVTALAVAAGVLAAAAVVPYSRATPPDPTQLVTTPDPAPTRQRGVARQPDAAAPADVRTGPVAKPGTGQQPSRPADPTATPARSTAPLQRVPARRSQYRPVTPADCSGRHAWCLSTAASRSDGRAIVLAVTSCANVGAIAPRLTFTNGREVAFTISTVAGDVVWAGIGVVEQTDSAHELSALPGECFTWTAEWLRTDSRGRAVPAQRLVLRTSLLAAEETTPSVATSMFTTTY